VLAMGIGPRVIPTCTPMIGIFVQDLAQSGQSLWG
jgi:hypothetical protein